MRRSTNTLLGRVHEQARLEARRDVDALYAFVDPVLRTRREAQAGDEPERTLGEIRSFVATLRSAEVEAVEILEARKICERYGRRPAALVRSVVRYNDEPFARETRTIWVRDNGAWYTTALGTNRPPAA